MKKLLCIALCLALLSGCAAPAAPTTEPQANEVQITLSDSGIEFPADSGIETTKEDIHTVVRITRPGTYRVSGSITAGQLAVDLGEDAAKDPNATVLLILDNAEIICRTGPAVLFRNVWESGVPNGLAGAHVLLTQGSKNRVVGVSTEEYDGAFYSRMSMKLDGAGSLRIECGNEGLCSERHLTIDGGDISISSGNDGINANADGESVITINDGRLWIGVAGETGEGDGIDSNGSVVINGGHIEAYACADSMDSGIDADLGIFLNGGTVIATGNMLDRIEDGGQTHAVFSFAQQQKAPYFTLKDLYGSTVLEAQTPSAFTNLLFSSPDITEGTYTLWSGETQYEGVTSVGGGGFAQLQPIDRPEFPGKGDDGRVEIPPQPTQPIVTHGTVQPPAEGDRPADLPVAQFPQDGAENMPVPPMPPEGAESMPVPQLPEGATPPKEAFDRQPVEIITGALSTEFAVKEGGNYFTNVRAVEK